MIGQGPGLGRDRNHQTRIAATRNIEQLATIKAGAI